MKRVSIVAVVLAVVMTMSLAGCAAKGASTAGNVPSAPTLPTNARDAVDANAFRVIADAYAFLSSIRGHIADGSLSLTAAQKTAFNDVVVSYDAAYALGVAYHAGTSTDSSGLDAVASSLQTKLATASTQIAVPGS